MKIHLDVYRFQAPLDELAKLASAFIKSQESLEYNGGKTLKVTTLSGPLSKEHERLIAASAKRCEKRGKEFIMQKDTYTQEI